MLSTFTNPITVSSSRIGARMLDLIQAVSVIAVQSLLLSVLDMILCFFDRMTSLRVFISSSLNFFCLTQLVKPLSWYPLERTILAYWSWTSIIFMPSAGTTLWRLSMIESRISSTFNVLRIEMTFLASASAKIRFFFSTSLRLCRTLINSRMSSSACLRRVISTIETITLDRSLS